MDDGREVRTMTVNQEGFFIGEIEKYFELCKEKGGGGSETIHGYHALHKRERQGKRNLSSRGEGC